MNKLMQNKRHTYGNSRPGRPRDAYDFTPQETRDLDHVNLDPQCLVGDLDYVDSDPRDYQQSHSLAAETTLVQPSDLYQHRKRAHSEDLPDEAFFAGLDVDRLSAGTPDTGLFVRDDRPPELKRARRPDLTHLRDLTVDTRRTAVDVSQSPTFEHHIVDSIEEDDEDQHTPLHRSRAHEMKTALGALPFLPNAGNRKRMPEHDPENHEILRMRTEERMAWADIAKALNDKRTALGKVGSFTEAAVYGRFVRNAPRIAAANGKTLNPRDYMHLKETKKMTDGGIQVPVKWESRQDEMLIEAVADVQSSVWESVSQVLETKSGQYFSPEACAKRYQQI